jgi:hypothetical protein
VWLLLLLLLLLLWRASSFFSFFHCWCEHNDRSLQGYLRCKNPPSPFGCQELQSWNKPILMADECSFLVRIWVMLTMLLIWCRREILKETAPALTDTIRAYRAGYTAHVCLLTTSFASSDCLHILF